MARWIKVYDKLLEWEWHDNPNMVSLFIHLLLMANAKDGRYRGVPVKRGQLITSRSALSEATGISEQSIRTCLDNLKWTEEISLQATKRWTIITICNYDAYQGEKETSNQEVTKRQPSETHKINQVTNQESTKPKRSGTDSYKAKVEQPNQATNQESTKQLTTNIEYIDIYNNPPLSKESVPPLKKIATMEERAKNFGKQLVPYVETYGKEMIRDFYDYWTGHDEGDTKLAFEKAKSRSKSGVFNIARRLATWKRKADEDKEKRQPRRYQKGSTIQEALEAVGATLLGGNEKLIGQ